MEKCKKCKRPIGKLSIQTEGFCPRCIKTDPKQPNPFDKPPEDNGSS